MDDGGLEQAFERAEQALVRIERAVADDSGKIRDEALRTKVREAVAQLDQLIQSAGR